MGRHLIDGSDTGSLTLPTLRAMRPPVFRHYRADDLGGAEPTNPALWYRLHPTVAAAVAAVLYAAIFTLRVAVARPGDAVSVLYIFPVALLAVTFGLVGGMVGASVGIGLEVFGYSVFHGAPPDVLGWSTQGTVVLVLGALLGHATDRKRAVQRWALAEQERRLHLEELACRERAALEINDSLIQGMTAAKWLIEQRKDDLALDELSLTIDHGEHLVTDLLLRNPVADSRRAIPEDRSGRPAHRSP